MSKKPIIWEPIPELDEDDIDVPVRRGSSTPLVKEDMGLVDWSVEQILSADTMEIVEICSAVPEIWNDQNLQDFEDIRERLVLIKRKQMGLGWRVELDNTFACMHVDNRTKTDALYHLIQSVDNIFRKISTDSLSAVLKKEGHLTRDLSVEIDDRMNILQNCNSTVIIAGETNGGKSSFLNLLLGEDILPTDVLHCTYAICRIMYSETYSIHTINYRDERQDFYCASLKDARELLKENVAREGVHERLQGSLLKEVTLKMPSKILKGGVTLVDTPGIGEDDQMDDVTMNFVKSTHASAFIYIIKSDTAGGVQEDRLLSFLRAIKQRYETGLMKEYFDPLAAMFVCHRWDNIEESQREKVKQNALKKLEDVWPGFQPSQMFFFSTKNTMKHLPVDPEFITESYYSLLKGLKALFDRASYNSIKHQYIWLKHILQSGSRHLKAMITHCIRGNEELEIYFQSVAFNQEKLRLNSKENSTKLQEELKNNKEQLKLFVKDFLLLEDHRIQELDDFSDLMAECTKDKYLSNQANRKELDANIVRALIKYAIKLVNESGAVVKMEQNMVQSIETHLGLFKCQIREIKNQILHGETDRSHDNPDSLNQSYSSLASTSSRCSVFEDFHKEVVLDPSELTLAVNAMLSRRKDKQMKFYQPLSNIQEASQTLMVTLKDFFHKYDKVSPETYLIKRVKKISQKMRQDDLIVTSIVKNFVEWMQACVNQATNSIPNFITINTTLMDNIREHREDLQGDKEKLKTVMEELEPSRDHLKGFGSLYMEDINADMVDFTLSDRKVSSVVIPKDLSVSARPLDDSGFQGSGSKQHKIKSLWGRLQSANISVDGEKEKVILKTYTYDLDIKDFFSEIACLRYLDDNNIAQFFGMTRIKTAQSGGATFGKAVPDNIIDQQGQKVSAFIFKGELVAAKIHMSNKMINKREFVPRFVHSLLNGLKYIHREKLVHMELNLETVMVEKYTGIVKLCQMCRPREAKFPADLTQTKAASCICLSPSVLLGDEYKQTDDIYAFGLLLWDMLFPSKPAYKEQRDWNLQDFIDKCHPEGMLSPSLAELNPSADIEAVIKGTVYIKRGFVCMAIDIIQDYLKDLENDPTLSRLSRGGRFPVRKKSDPAPMSTAEDKTSGAKHLYTKNSPVRPPRKTDHLRNRRQSSPLIFSNSCEAIGPDTTEIKDAILPVNINRGRRQSAPTVLAANLMAVSESKGINAQKRIKVLSKMVRKVTGHQHSSFAVSDNNDVFEMVNSSAETGPSPQVKTREKSNLTVRGQVHARRFSLQDTSLIVPRSRSRETFSELPDVPQLMALHSQRFEKPLSSTLPYTRVLSDPMNLSFPGRLIPSESMPSLVPSVEDTKNKFFSRDEKLAESWQSPPLLRKSYSETESSPSKMVRRPTSDSHSSACNGFRSASEGHKPHHYGKNLIALTPIIGSSRGGDDTSLFQDCNSSLSRCDDKELNSTKNVSGSDETGVRSSDGEILLKLKAHSLGLTDTCSDSCRNGLDQTSAGCYSQGSSSSESFSDETTLGRASLPPPILRTSLNNLHDSGINFSPNNSSNSSTRCSNRGRLSVSFKEDSEPDRGLSDADIVAYTESSDDEEGYENVQNDMPSEIDQPRPLSVPRPKSISKMSFDFK